MAESAPAPDWKALAVLLVERRKRLGFRAQKDLAAVAGVSTRVISQLETAAGANYRPKILHSVEKALGWVSGSVEEFLASGRQPVTISTPVREKPPVITTDPVLVNTSAILTEMQLVQRLHRMIDSIALSQEDVGIAVQLANEFSRNVSDLAGPYVTRLIEHNISQPGGHVHPLIEHIIAPYVDEALPADATEAQIEEMTYKRWLSGRTTEITLEQQERFNQRWKAAQQR